MAKRTIRCRDEDDALLQWLAGHQFGGNFTAMILHYALKEAHQAKQREMLARSREASDSSVA